MSTVLPQLVPAGTILFWGSEGRVLIKGGLYSENVQNDLEIKQKKLNFRVKIAILPLFPLIRYNSRAGTNCANTK